VKIVRPALAAALFAFVLIACQSSGQQQQPQPAPQPQQPQQQAAGPCGGIQIFTTPACQAALDQVCCPMETECGKDPGCVQLTHCIQNCKSQNGARAKDNCSNGCATQSRYQYCNAACQGQGADCPTICMQRGGPAEPMVKWGLVASCSKDVRYPQGVTCNDST